MRSSRLIALGLSVTLAVSGCSLFKASKKDTLPGQRISVLELEHQLEPDPGLASTEVALPSPKPNRDWPQVAGGASHFVGHPLLADTLTTNWTVAVGEGASRYGLLLTGPIVAGGVLYTMDAKSLVSAWKATDGTRLWETDLTPEDDESQAWGGGVAFYEGRIYATTGFGQVVAMEAETGKEVWRVSLGSPLRAAPTVAGNRVFIVTVDNQLITLSAGDGSKLWTYDGIPEAAQLAGGSSPAVEGETVVAAFTSGEIAALRVDNGRVLWTDSLAATKRFDPMSTLADVHGQPVIDRGRVYAVSHSGRVTAIDLRSGARIWEQEVGSAYTPWVVGDYIYLLSGTGEIVCLTREDGRVRWLRQLDRWEDPEDKEDPIQWAGPVLAGDRLVVLASNGVAWSVSPYTGEVLGQMELPAGSFLPPVVAGGTLYLTTNDADLMALR